MKLVRREILDFRSIDNKYDCYKRIIISPMYEVHEKVSRVKIVFYNWR